MNTTVSPSNEPHLKTTRVRFANMLVAVDLSASSANTLKIAANLANQQGSRLVIAHVLDRRPGGPSETAADIRARIDLWMKPYLTPGARVSIAMTEGDVVPQISRLIKEHGSDLLIIGTHAATNVERLVLGSTAEALFRTVSIPVLTIGPHVRAPHGAFGSIIFPTGLAPGSLRAAQYAVSLAEESNSILTLLHVIDTPEEPGSRELATLKLQQLVPADAELWCRPAFRVESGNLTEAILAAAEETRAELIVLGVTHKRLLADHAHWSVASAVVRSAECPVLTVRDHL